MPHLVASVGLVAGTLLMLLWGGEAPSWFLRLELLAVMTAALTFGFSNFTLAAPSWFWLRPVRGVVCVYLGVGAMFCPPQFIISAIFIGVGCRLILGETHRKIAVVIKAGTLARQAAAAMVVRPGRDIR